MSTRTSETNLECPHPNEPAPGFAALPEGPQVEGFGFDDLDEHAPARGVLVFVRPVASWLAITVSGVMIMAYAMFGARPPPPHIVPDPDDRPPPCATAADGGVVASVTSPGQTSAGSSRPHRSW
jgi:hypothetical protein